MVHNQRVSPVLGRAAGALLVAVSLAAILALTRFGGARSPALIAMLTFSGAVAAMGLVLGASLVIAPTRREVRLPPWGLAAGAGLLVLVGTGVVVMNLMGIERRSILDGLAMVGSGLGALRLALRRRRRSGLRGHDRTGPQAAE